MFRIDVQHGGGEAKFVCDVFLPRDQVDVIKDAIERGKRLFHERMEEMRRRDTDDTRQLAHLHERKAAFAAQAAEERGKLDKATAELKQAIAGGKDPAAAQGKLDAHAAQLKNFCDWQAQLEAGIKVLIGRLERALAGGLHDQREAHFQSCEQRLAEFEMLIKKFLADHGPALAEAQAGREAAGLDRQRHWPRAVA
jgi:hypothetical protein